MKQKYDKPNLEMITFEVEDVITTSSLSDSITNPKSSFLDEYETLPIE